MDTSPDNACAMCARRLSFGTAPYTSLHDRTAARSELAFFPGLAPTSGRKQAVLCCNALHTALLSRCPSTQRCCALTSGKEI